MIFVIIFACLSIVVLTMKIVNELLNVIHNFNLMTFVILNDLYSHVIGMKVIVEIEPLDVGTI